MTEYRDTQLGSWEAIQDKLSQTKREVLRTICSAGLDGISTIQISEKLNWPINNVSGRVTELCDDGVVTDSGRRCTNPSGRPAILWVAVQKFKCDNDGQLEFC